MNLSQSTLNNQKLPPSLPWSPFKQLRTWLSDPETLLETGRAQLGDTFSICVGGLKAAVSGNPEVVQALFQGGIDCEGENLIFEPVLGARSVIVTSGEEHRSLRAKLLPFFQGRALRGSVEQIDRLVENGIADLANTSLDVRQQMEELTLRIIIDFIFGRLKTEHQVVLVEAARHFLGVFRSRFGLLGLFFPALRFEILGWGPAAEIRRRKQALDGVIERVLVEADAEELSHSIVGSLLPENATFAELLETKEEQAIRSFKTTLFDQIRTLLFAGFETTSSSLAWVLYHLSCDSILQDELRSELKGELFAEQRLNLSSDSLLGQIWNETLRRYPIAPITFVRKLKQPISFSEEGVIPAGWGAAPSMVLSHFDQAVWGPDVKTWRPSRFKNSRPTPFQFYPFGGGIRRCLGSWLANLEVATILKGILLNYELSCASSKEPQLLRRGITMLPVPSPVVRYQRLGY